MATMTDTEKLNLLIRDDPEISGKMYARMKMHINEATVVDAVEIVRCKDCTSYEELYHVVGEEGNVCRGGYCYHWNYEYGCSPNRVDGDDFCSYGNREVEDGK